MARALLRISIAMAIGVGCSRPADPPPAPLVCPPILAAPVDSSRQRLDEQHEQWWAEQTRKEPFQGGRQAFETVRETLLSQYHTDTIKEDDLYRAATRGMLEEVEPSLRKWNKLLPPKMVARLQDERKGQIVGLGMRMHVDPATGRAEIASVVPNTPASRAGLKVGDLLVSVDGKLCKGAETHDALDALRGPVGSRFVVQVLRADKLLSQEVTREAIAIDQVVYLAFEGGVGYLAVFNFSDRTQANLEAAMGQLSSNKPKALVLDLRDNLAGKSEDVLAVAGQFLSAGDPLMVLEKRGGRTETLKTKSSPRVTGIPMVVLVNRDTSGVSEVLAAGLQERLRARIVGMQTAGKWSTQEVKELPNGFAYELTTAVFKTPAGRSFEGVGLPPDVQVDMTNEQLALAKDLREPAALLKADPQLRTAVSMLQSQH